MNCDYNSKEIYSNNDWDYYFKNLDRFPVEDLEEDSLFFRYSKKCLWSIVKNFTFGIGFPLAVVIYGNPVYRINQECLEFMRDKKL